MSNGLWLGVDVFKASSGTPTALGRAHLFWIYWESETPMKYEGVAQEAVEKLVRKCLKLLYTRDADLFDRNNGEGVCERCLVFRFAHYLQNEIDDYKVDCDFDSSYDFDLIQGTATPSNIKQIPWRDGTTSDRTRYVDIIVHKRTAEPSSDFFCFEFKKWNRGTQEERDEDLNKLEKLTSVYNYEFGFFIELGANKNTTKWTAFRRGVLGSERYTDDQPVFPQ
ncbi:MAG: hypothetical protein ACFFER_04825 [Candidatus Thorarchaeota archaeon]